MNPPAEIPGSFERHADPVVRAASDWLVIRDRGLTAGQREEFESWLRADVRHAAIFAQLEQTWDMLASMPEQAVETDESAEGESHANAPRRSNLAWVALPLAAAAALAIAYVGWWRSPVPMSYVRAAFTAVGDLQKLDLPDGSVVQLNTDSAVEVAYTAAERRVKLVRGEAHFLVAKSRNWPFIVTAAAIDVRAVGTAFNVHMRPTGVEVLVTDGRVAVADARDGRSLLTLPSGLPAPNDPRGADSPPSLLTTGKKAVIPIEATSNSPAIASVTMIDAPKIAQTLAWRERQLQFISQPLSDIVAEFNRYNRHKLTIGDPFLAIKRFGGTFPSNDYASLVQLLHLEFGVIVERHSHETVLRLPE